jgi:uncharacterized OB-fold protein
MKSIQQRQRFAKSGMPSRGIRCRNCGATTSQPTKYCTECGSEMRAPSQQSREPNVRKYTPEVIQGNLERMRNHNPNAYADFVQGLVMVDESGKYWSIGSRSSQWYVCEERNWVAAQPVGTMRVMQRDFTPGMRPIAQPVPVGVSKPVRPRADKTVRRKRTSASDSKVTVSGRSKFCTKCGRKIGADYNFCEKCGTPTASSIR